MGTVQIFLDALASLAFKLQVSEWVSLHNLYNLHSLHSLYSLYSLHSLHSLHTPQSPQSPQSLQSSQSLQSLEYLLAHLRVDFREFFCWRSARRVFVYFFVCILYLVFSREFFWLFCWRSARRGAEVGVGWNSGRPAANSNLCEINYFSKYQLVFVFCICVFLFLQIVSEISIALKYDWRYGEFGRVHWSDSSKRHIDPSIDDFTAHPQIVLQRGW